MTLEASTYFFPRGYDWEHEITVIETDDISFFTQERQQNAESTGPSIEHFYSTKLDTEAPECAHELRELTNICPKHHLDILEVDNTSELPTGSVAWLDERDINGTPRSTGGSVDIRDLYGALKAKVLSEKPSQLMSPVG